VAARDGSGAKGLTPDWRVGHATSDGDATILPDGKTVVFVRWTDDAQ